MNFALAKMSSSVMEAVGLCRCSYDVANTCSSTMLYCCGSCSYGWGNLHLAISLNILSNLDIELGKLKH